MYNGERRKNELNAQRRKGNALIESLWSTILILSYFYFVSSGKMLYRREADTAPEKKVLLL